MNSHSLRRHTQVSYLNEDEWLTVRHGFCTRGVVISVHAVTDGFGVAYTHRVIDSDTVAVRLNGRGATVQVVVIG